MESTLGLFLCAFISNRSNSLLDGIDWSTTVPEVYLFFTAIISFNCAIFFCFRARALIFLRLSILLLHFCVELFVAEITMTDMLATKMRPRTPR